MYSLSKKVDVYYSDWSWRSNVWWELSWYRKHLPCLLKVWRTLHYSGRTFGAIYRYNVRFQCSWEAKNKSTELYYAFCRDEINVYPRSLWLLKVTHLAVCPALLLEVWKGKTTGRRAGISQDSRSKDTYGTSRFTFPFEALPQSFHYGESCLFTTISYNL